jgi:hypothetical protein
MHVLNLEEKNNNIGIQFSTARASEDVNADKWILSPPNAVKQQKYFCFK